ncbi:MAG: 4-hydroxy-tetrahydrodipicolinate synthase [Prevotellaceae bacterium]|jgi:4-hydroxy-tetrahydrodipicolinate synthase|nr:4-hydroxy-tetrahydrodipicolinate synthase [Prevotellaceae bacterium]
MNTISGLGVALITPFKKDKSIDFEALGRIVEHVTAGGSDFLVVLGTTAENPVLDVQEKRDIVRFVAERNHKKLPLVTGVGGNNTKEVVNNVTNLYAEADAVLSVAPYYNKPSQRGLIEHFTAIADASPKPVIIYNVPGRTGVNITADTCLKLSEHRNITAIKEASTDLNQLSYILRDRPADFTVLSGDDGLTLAQIAMGIDGVISVVANAFPQKFGDMVHTALKGDFSASRLIYLQMIEVINLLFAEGNPVGVKAVMSIQGLIENELRLPLAESSKTLYEKFVRLGIASWK